MPTKSSAARRRVSARNRLVDVALPVLELQFLDSTGSKGTTTVKYPLGTTVAVIDASASAFASLIAPLTGCTLIRQRIIFKAAVSPRDVPDTGSLVHNVGMFIFNSASDAPLELIAVPGILSSVLVTDGPTAGYGIDLANGYVDTLVAAIIENGLSNPFGDDIVSIAAAYRQSRT